MPKSWEYTFRARDYYQERSNPQRDAERAKDEGGEPCRRADWCSGATFGLEDGQRVVYPRRTYRAYCHACEEYLTGCVAELAGLYQRMAAAIGDPMQAEVWVPSPFGPQLVLREDIDAHMRLMAVLLPGWESRVRSVMQLSRPDYRLRTDTPEAITRACETLTAHSGVLFALQPAWMTRTYRMPMDEETAERIADLDAVRSGEDYIVVMQMTGAAEAGQELQYLHYRARSVLLETPPPPEILIPPCRQCELRTLRRAWPEAGADRDLYSRCANCRDEMTSAEYDVNATRWLAYHRASARELPVLLEAS